MRLSISNIGWEKENDQQVYELMKKYGFSGIEIAPTRWVQENPYEHVHQAVEIANHLKEQYGFVVSSMQSIWFGRSERVFIKEEREVLVNYTKKAIDYAAEIGCKNLVFGSPRNRNIEEAWNLSGKDIATIEEEFFGEIGEYAKKAGVVVAMEANPPMYNTNYVNDTGEAISLAERVNSTGFLVNLDFGTIIANEEDISELEEKVHLIHHVHISEPGLKQIQVRTQHEELAECLRRNRYEGFVSIEVGKQDDLQELEKMMKYVAEVFHD